MSLIAINDIHLNVEVSGKGPPLLLLHGFTGSAATWTPHAPAWEGFTTVAVDLLGHGDSDHPRDPGRYRMERCVDDLAALLEQLGIERAALLGYSMGGRIALRLALRSPGRISALVLESAAPGIEDVAERETRMRSDAALADAIERDGIAAFVDRWESQPLFSSQATLPEPVRSALRRQRLSNDPRGLANSLRGIGAGAEEPVFDRLSELRMPVLLITGALDEKYCSLARRTAAALRSTRHEVVADAGHAVHLEEPEAFAEAVRSFLSENLSMNDERSVRDAGGMATSS